MDSFFKSTIYGDLTKMVQIVFNEASKKKVTLFGQTYIDRFFDFKNPQFGLTVSELMGDYKIRIMASLIADKALTPVRSWEGAEKFTEKIPRFGHKTILNADQLREIKNMLATQSISSDPATRDAYEASKKQELINTMMGTVQETVLGTKDALEYLFISALFNAGIVEYNELNNPEGIRYKIDYGMPESNKIKVESGHEWTKENLASGKVDPVEFLIDLIQQFSDTMQFDAILMHPKMRYNILRSKYLRLAVRGVDKAATPIKEDELDQSLKGLGIPRFESIYKQNAVLKDGKRQNISPVSEDSIVLVPAGKIGVVRTAFEDNEIIPEKNVSYSNMSNGIRVAQWTVGESSGQAAGEYTQASIRALPIITSINGILNVKVNNLG